jgi:uncharacterized protein (TIGR02145 family)
LFFFAYIIFDLFIIFSSFFFINAVNLQQSKVVKGDDAFVVFNEEKGDEEESDLIVLDVKPVVTYTKPVLSYGASVPTYGVWIRSRIKSSVFLTKKTQSVTKPQTNNFFVKLRRPVLTIVKPVVSSVFETEDVYTKCDDSGVQSSGTVNVGGHKWLKSNQNIGCMTTNKTLKTDASENWCYGNDTENCKKDGALYTWEAAQNVCPAGFEVPTMAQINDGMRDANGSRKALMNDRGFGGTLNGYKMANGMFYKHNELMNFWSSDKGRHFWTRYDEMHNGYAQTSLGLGVRCVAK